VTNGHRLLMLEVAEFCTLVNLATLSEWLRLSTTHCWTS